MWTHYLPSHAVAHKKLYAAGNAKSTSDMCVAPGTERELCGCKPPVRFGLICTMSTEIRRCHSSRLFLQRIRVAKMAARESVAEITPGEGANGDHVYSAVSPPKLSRPSPDI